MFANAPTDKPTMLAMTYAIFGCESDNRWNGQLANAAKGNANIDANSIPTNIAMNMGPLDIALIVPASPGAIMLTAI